MGADELEAGAPVNRAAACGATPPAASFSAARNTEEKSVTRPCRASPSCSSSSVQAWRSPPPIRATIGSGDSGFARHGANLNRSGLETPSWLRKFLAKWPSPFGFHDRQLK